MAVRQPRHQMRRSAASEEVEVGARHDHRHPQEDPQQPVDIPGRDALGETAADVGIVDRLGRVADADVLEERYLGLVGEW